MLIFQSVNSWYDTKCLCVSGERDYPKHVYIVQSSPKMLKVNVFLCDQTFKSVKNISGISCRGSGAYCYPK